MRESPPERLLSPPERIALVPCSGRTVALKTTQVPCQVSNPSMLIVPVVVGVDLENCLDKMSDLLIAPVQI